MSDYREELKKTLFSKSPSESIEKLTLLFQSLNEKELSHLFIDSKYLNTIIALIIDDLWIQSQKQSEDFSFEKFIKRFFASELKPLLYLQSAFSNTDLENLKKAFNANSEIELRLLDFIQKKPTDFKKTFLQNCLHQMSELFEIEYQLNLSRKKSDDRAQLSLYRTFDVIDQVLDLEYITDEVCAPEQKERLYEGAGLGVQSSYATILLALRYLNLKKGSIFVDLGSGYGRLGFVLGLLRPDIQFKGYEFMNERVLRSNQICSQLKIEKHVEFLTQDLSQVDFKIPKAHFYYIFDSFTDATYEHIIQQLQTIAEQQNIIVITKGNARLWFKNKSWSEPQEFNGANLCFFRSR